MNSLRSLQSSRMFPLPPRCPLPRQPPRASQTWFTGRPLPITLPRRMAPTLMVMAVSPMSMLTLSMPTSATTPARTHAQRTTTDSQTAARVNYSLPLLQRTLLVLLPSMRQSRPVLMLLVVLLLKQRVTPPLNLAQLTPREAGIPLRVPRRCGLTLLPLLSRTLRLLLPMPLPPLRNTPTITSRRRRMSMSCSQTGIRH